MRWIAIDHQFRVFAIVPSSGRLSSRDRDCFARRDSEYCANNMPLATTTLRRLLKTLFRLLCSSWKHVRRFISYILKHPQAGELVRFVFLGSILETARTLTAKIPEYFNSLFVVTASFPRGDISFDWVYSCVEHQQVWDRSRTFGVRAQNTDKIEEGDVRFKSGDGYLDAVYQPAWTPELFHWKNKHWITICVDQGGLTLQVWSLSHNVLDEFIREARHFFQTRVTPPPYTSPFMAQHLVAGLFNSGDFSHTWIYEYLQAQDLMTAENQFVISTQESDAGWSRQGKKQIHTLPYQSAPGLSVHRFRWRSYWVQADIYGSTRSSQITILIHSCDTSVLLDFIEDARLHYAQASISRVNVHLTDGYASWGRVVTKSRRSFSTLILQDGIKETLVSDVKEFLDNKEWYAFAGVPHRRGYLLFGDPGTGKSTTVHALAGELGMEIYFVSLASPGMNDHSLGELFHSTPPHSILLIEDLDVAFPPRGQDAPEAQTKADEEGRPVEPRRRPRSRVTLAGLLNILDSVASQEGYVLIATTNHIHQLDPALIRPGRIDVQIKYGLAVPEQLENVFHRFYPAENATNPAHPWSAKGTGATTEEIHDMAREFAAAIPESKYSIAQLQGYLLGFKNDPKGAVQGITAWVADREREAKEPKPPQQWESEDDEGYNDDY